MPELAQHMLHLPFMAPCARCHELTATGLGGGLILVDRDREAWTHFCGGCAPYAKDNWSDGMYCVGCEQSVSNEQVAVVELYREDHQAIVNCFDCVNQAAESLIPE